jgi:hypothetical protein
MVERRPLVEGLKPTTPAPVVDAAREKEFIYGGKPATDSKPQSSATQTVSRVPISTRIRSDFSTALKRASLERQLNGVEPNTLQDMLEQALEPWLRSNGLIR